LKEMTSEQWRGPELSAWLYNKSPLKERSTIWGTDTAPTMRLVASLCLVPRR